MLIDHFNESLVVVALLFLVLPCGAASTSETNSASVPAHAASQPHTEYRIPNIPPLAGLQAAAVPLLPQAVPLSSIQSLLDLARHSACRDAARLIEDGNISAALAALDALTAGAFYWRGAVTNGFQQGFFVNALRGYCLERVGDIVKAYRSYQNSRACFDDTAVAMQCPEPRLEVFLGLGRTCLVAGRYTDAFNWLDLVRLEASADPRLAAAADRGLIRRAVEIGDYHDAITNYWDLQAQLANDEYRIRNDECRSEHTEPNHAEAVTGLASTVTGGMGAASAPRTSEDYKFVRRERIYSPKEYTELAQLYFWTHQDRPGFNMLLDGITLRGIDNDLGAHDPMVLCFLNNIMRADDAEIQRFYDLLGYAITQSRSLRGDEQYIAMLVNARNAMSRGFAFLGRTDDLSTVRKRINAVKGHLKKEMLAAAQRRDTARANAASDHAFRPGPVSQESGTAQLQNQYEDSLMSADVICVRDKSQQPAALFSTLYVELCKTNIGAAGYDGTVMALASRLGWLRAAGIVATNAELIWSEDYEPDSLREWSYCLWYEEMHANSATITVLHSWIVRSRALPRAYPALLSYLTRAAVAHKRCRDANGFIRCISECWQRKSDMNSDLYEAWSAACAAQGQCAAAFDVLDLGLQHTAFALERIELIQCCAQGFAWATDAALQNFNHTAYAALLDPFLNNPPMAFTGYRETYVPAQAVCVDEQRLRACIAANDLAGALNVFSNLPPAYVHSGTLSRLAECFARVGQTNAAFAALWRAYGMRCALASALGGDAIQYPVLETAQLEEWYTAAACEDAAHYLAWFAKRVHQCAQLQKPEHLDAMRISPLYHVAQQYTANTNLVWGNQ